MTRDRELSTECGKAFKDRRDLLTHEKKVHLNVRDHACDQCESAFSDSRHLMRHKRNVHTTVEGCICSFCDSSFKNNFVLLKHVKRVHGEEGKFACDECDKTFMSEAGLEKHKNAYCGRKTEPKEKRFSIKVDMSHMTFPCLLCGKTYAGPYGKASLARHVATSHDNKRYPCPYCDKVYTQDVVKRLHIQRVHKNIE